MKKYLYIALAALGMMGCEEELDRVSTGSGFLISLGDASVNVETKSTPEELGEPLKTNFSIEVLKQSTGESETYNYKENLVIPASVGLYDITASYGDNPELALDAPYYEGKAEDEEIKEGATEPVSVAIECTVANALASVVYEDEAKFQELFSSYGVNVKVGNLNVTLNNSNAGKSAYYQAGSKPTFTFVGTLKGNGKEVTKSLTAEDNSALGEDATFAAAKHCILTLSLGTTEPGVNLTLSKVEVEEVTINETIPLEWLPAPKVFATGFDETKTLDFYETNTPTATSIDFDVNEATGLQDLEFSLYFEDETFQELTGDYTLSTMSDEDKAKFADAGITLPLAGQTSPKIDFTSTFINKLRAKDEGAVVNTITINKVTANNRPNKDESPLVYTINTHKPEFTVEVWDGNVWSKTFTAEEITVAEGKGNLETIKQNLVYQYSSDGNSWTNFSDQTTRTQAFAEHPSGDAYRVRAIYRKALTSNVEDITLEENKPVPNGDMDAWTDGTRATKYTPFGLGNGVSTTEQPIAYPWDNEVPTWWDTNNIATMPTAYDIIKSASYACFPTTTYTTNGNSGKAAVIRSIGHGRSNSGAASGTKTRGILYVGITSDDGAIDEGQSWESRPTALSFYVKYNVYNNERFGAYVELYSGNTKIASGSHVPTEHGVNIDSFTKIEVPIDYTDETKKATEIHIRFCSVAEGENPAVRDISVNVPEGSNDNYTVWGGSVLYVDNVELIYGR